MSKFAHINKFGPPTVKTLSYIATALLTTADTSQQLLLSRMKHQKAAGQQPLKLGVNGSLIT
tara:strand:+ start:362 stop:547 length:186 start_codon:yes stop_codon:yes gene_type:complete